MFKQNIKKILLINPPYTFDTYLNIDRNAGTMQHPIISLASLAGASKDIVDIKILDFDVVEGDYQQILTDEISKFSPDMIGITATTPVFPALLEIARQIKKINRQILIVAGGVHVTTYPEESINSEDLDIVIVGEADFFLRDFIESKDRSSMKGAYFKNNGKTIFNGRVDLIRDLDSLPYPYWQLYDLSKYRASRLIEHHSPAGLLETSRGCPFLCNYCNKRTFGSIWRKKSIGRVISEFRNMKNDGFKEIHVEDDGFSTELPRAKKICRELIENKIDIPWTLLNGIRVDRIDQELFELLKEAGCYQVAFGIESGDDAVLKDINKGISVKQVEHAVRLADKVGLETFGFFMFGLSGETEVSMKKTIELAKRLPLTIAKFGITVPYPGTPLFEKLDSQGKILHKDWRKYLIHNNKIPVFIHENLSWDMIQLYYKRAYREFYFRPSQFYRQLKQSLKDGTIFDRLFYLLKTRWF